MAVKDFEDLKEVINDELTKQYTNGLKVGTHSITQVIYEKAIGAAKSDKEKLADIIKFCEVSLGKH